MRSKEAYVQQIAIGFQESRFIHRLQIRGPARSFYQFEKNGGVRGVISHPATSHIAEDVCNLLRVPFVIEECYHIMAYNDALASAFARLLLWTNPNRLPRIGDIDCAWDYYLETWRPGKPHRDTWNEMYDRAIRIVENG